MQDLQRVLISRDVQLVARAAGESATPIRANLGCDLEGAQKAERATRDSRIGDIEMNGHLSASSEMDAPRRVEEP